jgi:hydrogenase expression/formation protein HypC
MAEVEFGGITRPCHMACVPDAKVGEYVIVHVGVAIAKIDADAAQRTLIELACLPDTPDWPTEPLAEPPP